MMAKKRSFLRQRLHHAVLVRVEQGVRVGVVGEPERRFDAPGRMSREFSICPGKSA